MSCATHRLDGGIPVAVSIVDSKGKEIDKIVS
jgi:hypothetical protein